MHQPGERLRRQVRQARRQAVRENRRLLAIPVVAGGTIMAGIALAPMPVWWRAFLIGFYSAAILCLLGACIQEASGCRHLLLGRMGEEATASAVSGRRWRRQGWRAVHGLHFVDHGDIDHVLVGPGGVYAIESKWTTVPWEVRDDAIIGPPGRCPVRQAGAGAAKIELLLRYGPARLPVTVRPVLVLWGIGAPSLPGGHQQVGSVDVFEGRHPQALATTLTIDTLTPAQVDQILGVLIDFQDRQHQLAVSPTRTRAGVTRPARLVGGPPVDGVPAGTDSGQDWHGSSPKSAPIRPTSTCSPGVRVEDIP